MLPVCKTEGGMVQAHYRYRCRCRCRYRLQTDVVKSRLPAKRPELRNEALSAVKPCPLAKACPLLGRRLLRPLPLAASCAEVRDGRSRR